MEQEEDNLREDRMGKRRRQLKGGKNIENGKITQGKKEWRRVEYMQLKYRKEKKKAQEEQKIGLEKKD